MAAAAGGGAGVLKSFICIPPWMNDVGVAEPYRPAPMGHKATRVPQHDGCTADAGHARGSIRLLRSMTGPGTSPLQFTRSRQSANQARSSSAARP